MNFTDSLTDSNSTSSQLRFNFTREEIANEHFYPAVLINRSVTPVWYLIGIVGNIVSALIWLRPNMRKNSSSAVYLAALSINDTVVLLLHPVYELTYTWFVSVVDYPVLCEFYAVIFLASQYMAPFLVLCFTVDRYIAICFPFKKHSFCTVKRAVQVVISMIALSLSLSCIQGYFWTYDYNRKRCTVRADLLVRLWTEWTSASEILVFFLVPVINLLVNLRVIREIYLLSSASHVQQGQSVKVSASKQQLQQQQQLQQLQQQQQQRRQTIVCKKDKNDNIPYSEQQQQLYTENKNCKINNIDNNKNNNNNNTNNNNKRASTSSTNNKNKNNNNNNITGRKSASSFGSFSNNSSSGNAAAATNVMLLSVSFYVIFTTLPPAIMYSLENNFEEGPAHNTTHQEIRENPVWGRYIVYYYLQTIIYEIALSHYACNFILFNLTGKKFRSNLIKAITCGRRGVMGVGATDVEGGGAGGGGLNSYRGLSTHHRDSSVQKFNS